MDNKLCDHFLLWFFMANQSFTVFKTSETTDCLFAPPILIICVCIYVYWKGSVSKKKSKTTFSLYFFMANPNVTVLEPFKTLPVLF